MIREDYSFMQAVVPNDVGSHSSRAKDDYRCMGYADPFWDEYKRQHRNELYSLNGLKYIVGWAEQAHGGWVGYARDDQGSVHRTGVVRPCQLDAIYAARSLVNQLRQQQILNRCLYTDAYGRVA